MIKLEPTVPSSKVAALVMSGQLKINAFAFVLEK